MLGLNFFSYFGLELWSIFTESLKKEKLLEIFVQRPMWVKHLYSVLFFTPVTKLPVSFYCLSKF